MSEMAVGGFDEDQAKVLGHRENLGVSFGPAGSNDAGYSSLGQQLDAIGEWKKGIRGRHRPNRAFTGLIDCPSRRPDPTLVAGTDPDRFPTDRQNDRVGLGVGGNRPGEAQILEFVR